MQIKIFGERNTATNALSALIKRNSSSDVLPGSASEVNPEAFKLVTRMRQSGSSNAVCEGEIDKIFLNIAVKHQWKHAAPKFSFSDDLKDVFFVFLVKNPLSWVYSLYKNPYHQLSPQSKNFREFYFNDWILLGRDNLPISACKPGDLYREKLFSYIRLIEQLKIYQLNWAVLKFEDFIISQESVFNLLKSRLDKPSSKFYPIQESTKDRSKDLVFYQNYYGQELWKKEIDQDIITNFNFDRQLLQYFGY